MLIKYLISLIFIISSSVFAVCIESASGENVCMGEIAQRTHYNGHRHRIITGPITQINHQNQQVRISYFGMGSVDDVFLTKGCYKDFCVGDVIRIKNGDSRSHYLISAINKNGAYYKYSSDKVHYSIIKVKGDRSGSMSVKDSLSNFEVIH